MSELLNCPFCNAAMSIESNRDWHRIVGEHDERCLFMDRETVTVPATPDQLMLAVLDWNRRATQPAAGEPATVDDLARRLFAAFAKAEPESGITLNPTSYWATFADMARAVLQDAPPAAAHGDDRVAGLRWVIARCAVMQEKGFERVLLKAFKRDLEVALDAMRAQAGEGGEV